MGWMMTVRVPPCTSTDIWKRPVIRDSRITVHGRNFSARAQRAPKKNFRFFFRAEIRARESHLTVLQTHLTWTP